MSINYLSPPAIDLEEGAKECPPILWERIEKLLKGNRRIICIAINGLSTNVGKSYIHALIGKKLVETHFPNVPSSDFDDLHSIHAISLEMQSLHRESGVIISDNFENMCFDTNQEHEMFRISNDKFLQKNTSGILHGIDLWIAIHKHDRPFSCPPVADIVIRNLGAKVDRYKYK